MVKEIKVNFENPGFLLSPGITTLQVFQSEYDVVKWISIAHLKNDIAHSDDPQRVLNFAVCWKLNAFSSFHARRVLDRDDSKSFKESTIISSASSCLG